MTLFAAGSLFGAALIGLPLLMNTVEAPTGAQAETQATLVLAKSGVFYAGGRYDKDHPDQHFVGQMYVEYQIPADQRHPYPIVLVHGGGQTGAGWQTTPDGRPGWAQYFLRTRLRRLCRRSGRARPLALQPRSLWRDERAAARICRAEIHQPGEIKLWPQAALHTQWPGTGEPGDPAFDQYWASNMPGMENRVHAGADEHRRACSAARPRSGLRSSSSTRNRAPMPGRWPRCGRRWSRRSSRPSHRDHPCTTWW